MVERINQYRFQNAELDGQWNINLTHPTERKQKILLSEYRIPCLNCHLKERKKAGVYET